MIPTADFNGNYAKECRDNIFKGLHIVFVESGGRGDFYFNFAHNCNVGIKKAMEYNPKWVVFSGDDAYKIDSPNILRSQLKEIDNGLVGISHIDPPRSYSGKSEYVGKRRKFTTIIENLLNRLESKRLAANTTKFKGNINIIEGPPYISSSIMSKISRMHNKLLYKYIYKYRDFVSFGIFSSKMIRQLVEKMGIFLITIL